MDDFIELNQKEIAIVSGGTEVYYLAIPFTLLTALMITGTSLFLLATDNTKIKKNHAYYHHKKMLESLSKKRHALIFGALTGTVAAAVVGCTLGAFLS